MTITIDDNELELILDALKGAANGCKAIAERTQDTDRAEFYTVKADLMNSLYRRLDQ